MMIYADVSSIPLRRVNSPELIGQLVEVLPHIPMDVDYPYSCSPGLLGSSGGSSTALCNGLVRPESDAQPLLTALSSAAHSLACVCACVLLACSVPPVTSAASARFTLRFARWVTSVHPEHLCQGHAPLARGQTRTASRVRPSAQLALPARRVPRARWRRLLVCRARSRGSRAKESAPRATAASTRMLTARRVAWRAPVARTATRDLQRQSHVRGALTTIKPGDQASASASRCPSDFGRAASRSAVREPRSHSPTVRCFYCRVR